jgi:multidrug resistance efflux pump
MISDFKRSKLRTPKRLLIKRLLSHWFFMVWLCAAVGAAVLYGRSSRFGGLTGVVEKTVIPVASLETAKLVSLNVKVGDRVKKGDILGKLESASLEGDILIDRARMADMVAGHQEGILQLVRQYESTYADAKAALDAEKMNQSSIAGELVALKQDLKRRQELLSQKVISELDATTMLPRIAELERAAEMGVPLLASLEARLIQAARGQTQLRKWLKIEEGRDMLEVMQDVVAKGQSNQDMFQVASELMGEKYLLRATIDGMVCEIYSVPGATVLEGAPVIDLIHETPATKIIGYVPEVYSTAITVGQMATVSRSSGDRIHVRAVVKFVAPVIDPLPTRLSPLAQASAGIEVRIRRVYFELQGAHDLIPGETVQIQLVSPLGLQISELLRPIFGNGSDQ